MNHYSNVSHFVYMVYITFILLICHRVSNLQIHSYTFWLWRFHCFFLPKQKKQKQQNNCSLRKISNNIFCTIKSVCESEEIKQNISSTMLFSWFVYFSLFCYFVIVTNIHKLFMLFMCWKSLENTFIAANRVSE